MKWERRAYAPSAVFRAAQACELDSSEHSRIGYTYVSSLILSPRVTARASTVHTVSQTAQPVFRRPRLPRENRNAMTELLDPLPESSGTRRKENTRARLVRASLDVFVDKGIDGATIDDLARAAGFTRGAFYSNFSSKEEVFASLFTTVTDELVDIVSAAAHAALEAAMTGNTATQTDEAVIRDVFSTIRPFSRQWCLLHSDAISRALRDQQIRSTLVAERLRLRAAIADVLELGLRTRGLRAAIPVSDLAQIFIGVFIDLLVSEQTEELEIEQLGTATIVRLLASFMESPSAPYPPGPCPAGT